MSDGVSVELQGLDNVLRKLDMLDRSGEVVLRRNVRRALTDIEREAKKLAPHSPLQPPTKQPTKSTGQLRSDIRHETLNRGLSGRVGTNVKHGLFQEFGTRRIPPRPFLLPALEMVRPGLVQRLVKDLNDTHKRIAAGGGAAIGDTAARRARRAAKAKGGS